MPADTLTTAGAARCAAALKLVVTAATPVATTGALAAGGTVRIATTSGGAPLPPRGSQGGLSVPTTNSTASATVAACENRSQSLRMNDEAALAAMVTRDELQSHLANVLEVERFRDYGPNGLQVEGVASIGTIVSGVTASLALIEAAIGLRADALLVHHGLFWRGHDGRVVGWLKQRLRTLLAHDVNLFAYHLPLDAHPQWGNNAQLGLRLGLTAGDRFGEQDLGFMADAAEPVSLPMLEQRIGDALGRAPLRVGGDGRALRRVAWCTGGAQGYFEAAIAAGADVYLTGEISEPQAHIARETGVAFVACGPHATERFGVQALGAHLAAAFGIEHHFVDVDNPA